MTTKTSRVILQAALELADMGYRVFPCQPDDKVPATEHGCHDATTDIETIEAWFEQMPLANLAVSTDGLLVVDVDDLKTPWLTEHELDTPMMSSTPREEPGGRHYWFRAPAGSDLHNTAGKLAEHVDTRAKGGYVVVPPSRRNRKCYNWLQGHGPVPVDELPEPPGWLLAELEASNRAPGERTAADTPDGNPIPEGQRNHALAALAGSMRRAGMGQSEIEAALLVANAERCKPPLSEGEVRKVARSIARYEPDQVTVARVENHYGQMFEDEPEEPAIEEYDPGELPSEFLKVPGLIGDVIDFTLATAHKPQPVLALAGAIALQAVLAARKIQDIRRNRTNLYIIGVAPSGAGKGHPVKVNRRILNAAGLLHLEGAEEFASDAGFLKAVELQPGILFQVDEFGRMLDDIANARQSHLKRIADVLLKLFSSADTAYQGRAYADPEKRVPIQQPCVVLHGSTVPEHLYEAMSGTTVTDGLVGRLTVFETERRPSRVWPSDKPIPEGILETVRWWGDFQPGGNLSRENPQPQVVNETPDARERFDALNDVVEDAKVFRPLWDRAEEKACALALIYAASRDPENMVVDLEAAHWACGLAEHLTRCQITMAGRHVSESPFDRQQKKALRFVREAGGVISRRAFTRKLQFLKPKEREELIENLLHTGQLRQDVDDSTRGRNKTVFMLPGKRQAG